MRRLIPLFSSFHRRVRPWAEPPGWLRAALLALLLSGCAGNAHLKDVRAFAAEAPKLTGYMLSNAVAVTIRDLDKIGDAIDDALAAGATTLDGVTFRLEDPAKAEQQAREQAIAQAKSKAETLASGAGVRITSVSSISETSAPVPYPVYYGGEKGAGGALDVSTPVQTGTNEVVVTVAVVYLID